MANILTIFNDYNLYDSKRTKKLYFKNYTLDRKQLLNCAHSNSNLMLLCSTGGEIDDFINFKNNKTLNIKVQNNNLMDFSGYYYGLKYIIENNINCDYVVLLNSSCMVDWLKPLYTALNDINNLNDYNIYGVGSKSYNRSGFKFSFIPHLQSYAIALPYNSVLPTFSYINNFIDKKLIKKELIYSLEVGLSVKLKSLNFLLKLVSCNGKSGKIQISERLTFFDSRFRSI